MTKLEAIELLDSDDHAVYSPKQAYEMAEAFGLPEDMVKVWTETDTRSEFKGLTLYGINPKTGKEFQEGDSTEIVDGMEFVRTICKYFKIEYRDDFFGRGSQHRECVGKINTYFNIKK